MSLNLKPKRKNKKRKPRSLHSLNQLANKPGLFGTIIKLMGMHRNVLLTGIHGVGKTQMILAAAKILKLKVKYFSAATMDPYADLAGIPIADRKKKIIEFFHDADLDKYDIFFFDELNRPHDDKVLNGLLEAVQFLQVQGRPFKRLVCCWAAMNPPDMKYQVDDVDPALLDRFHHYLTIPFEYSSWFFKNKFGDMGDVLVGWAKTLHDSKKQHVTPRRLEYIGDTIILTQCDLELVKTTVLKGALTEQDFTILCAKCARFFPATNITITDNSMVVGTILDRQTKASAQEINEALERLRQSESVLGTGHF